MKVTLREEPGFDDVAAVTRNLRERDRAEIFATRWGEDPDELARDTVASGAFRWGAYLGLRPVAMIGAMPRWPGVWSVWAYGTDEWPRVALTLTKHAKRFMIPALLYSGAARRVDCHALETHVQAREWMRRLGGKEGNRLDGYGKNGEDFVEYVWYGVQTKPADGG